MLKFEKMPLNDVVVERLEELLEEAKLGRINFLGFVTCEGGDRGDNGWVGEIRSYYCAYYGLQQLCRRLERQIEFESPVQDLSAPANLYAFDMSSEPAGYDFVAWLVNIKMMQAREGLAGPTKVCFLKKKGGLPRLDAAGRDMFYRHVMVPVLSLFDAVKDSDAQIGRRLPAHTYRGIVEAARKGELVPRIKPPEHLLHEMQDKFYGKMPVTITLREHKHWEHRNSDLTDWLRFAEYLKARGERVIFVRDTANADEIITGFETMPTASRDILVRAALYETAKCNMFVSNGPASLALFGSRPWLQFIHCSETEEYPQNRPDWWFTNHGIAPPEQFPWSGPNQRIIWESDTYEAMVRAWEQFAPAEAEAA